jgi:transposase
MEEDVYFKLEDEIDVFAKSIEECRIIQSIPKIGEKIAAMISSEIGEQQI